MSGILLDQNVPVGLRQFLSGHEVPTAYQMGWSDLSNGELLVTVEADGFDVLISCDQNLNNQQNIAGLRLGVLVLNTNRWAVLRTCGAEIGHAIANIDPGSFTQPSLVPRDSPS